MVFQQLFSRLLLQVLVPTEMLGLWAFRGSRGYFRTLQFQTKKHGGTEEFQFDIITFLI